MMATTRPELEPREARLLDAGAMSSTGAVDLSSRETTTDRKLHH